MTRRRTPQEKKLDEYTKDFVPDVDSVHGFRKTWPRQKARATRAYRRQVHQLLTSFEVRQEEDFPEQAHPEIVRLSNVSKSFGVAPMGEVIKRRLEGRVVRTARTRFFLHEYRSMADREQFANFLASQIAGRTENSRNIALHIQHLMDPSQRPAWTPEQFWWAKKHRWLKAFFQDEPEWEKRLRIWIASFEQE